MKQKIAAIIGAGPTGLTAEINKGVRSIFMRARYYDSRIGRFISRDPILAPMIFKGKHIWILPYLLEYPQYLSSYVYAINNPVNKVDPKGLSAWSCFRDYMRENGISLAWEYLGLFLSCMIGCATASGGVGVGLCAAGCAAAVGIGGAIGILIGCGMWYC
jgi:RHS repeat-associated protein